ncbi:biotin--[acetyl-CoA-carboxylase] ligase [Rhodoferax sp.]|uniref:biotin--[acetyl-CoA-carboxylase] ligase n=1 Tax=Rhodoferax sp. TaxID=50421 RepID=UPI002720CE06|nr:biotin--[acetyl-CoA-carboxylase] ligase [Rhodoferax sp.]MDO9195650.1 biotin--[acetyl-CoA-carboxylase] ligase [Rhodoferax sp.]
MSGAIRWPAEAIWEAVVADLPGFTVEILPEIDSTNTELMRRARAGRLEPVLLVAEQQTAGRGRLGRQWFSGQESDASAGTTGRRAGPPQARPAPSGGSAAHAVASVGATSLTFSLGLPLAPQDWSGLSLAVGVSIVQSLHPDLRLKWPNDVWLHDRKLAGILIETANLGDAPGARYAVVGVGINITERQAAGLATPPAWLGEVLPGVDSAQALLRIAAPLVQALKVFEVHGFGPFKARFNERDALSGLTIALSDGTSGVAQGVDGVGALLVQTAQGLKKITSSEVSVRPLEPPPYANL